MFYLLGRRHNGIALLPMPLYPLYLFKAIDFDWYPQKSSGQILQKIYADIRRLRSNSMVSMTSPISDFWENTLSRW